MKSVTKFQLWILGHPVTESAHAAWELWGFYQTYEDAVKDLPSGCTDWRCVKVTCIEH